MPENKLSILEFNSHISKSALSNGAYFNVFVTPPKAMITKNITEDLSFRIEATELPGKNIDTFEDGGGSKGPRRMIGYGQSITDITLTVILSEDLREKEFFSEWQDLVIGDYRSGGDSYDIGFYEDYIGTVKIYKLNNRGELVKNIELVEAYPIVVGANQVSWDNDSIQKLDVVFTYRNYIEKNER